MTNADAYAAALIESANEIHTEVRWQEELRRRAPLVPEGVAHQTAMDALLKVECTLRARAEFTSAVAL